MHKIVTIGGEELAGLLGGGNCLQLTAGASCSGCSSLRKAPTSLVSPAHHHTGSAHILLKSLRRSQDKILTVRWPSRCWPRQLLSPVCALPPPPTSLLQFLEHITLFPPLDLAVHWVPCLEHHFPTLCLAGACSSFKCALKYCSGGRPAHPV